MNQVRLLLAGSVLLCLSIPAVADSEFDVYVLQIGDGTPLGSSFRPITLLQYSGTGTQPVLTNAWEAPSTDFADRITMSPAFTTYGYLNRSVEGGHLVFVGLDAVVGTVFSEATRTVIGSFDLAAATFDTSTRVAPSDLRFRSAASVDGTQFWFAGQGPGVQYATLGATEATMVSSVNFQFADVQIFEGDLYVGRRAGGTRGVWVWEDLPTTADNQEITRLQNEAGGSGWISATPGGGYGSFQFYNSDILFIDHLNAGVNTIEVFTRSDPATYEWNLLEGPGQRLSGLQGINHLSAVKDGDQVRLFFTSGMGSNNSSLWTASWDPETQVFGTPERISTANEGYSFGGVVAIPVGLGSGQDLRITAIDFQESIITIEWEGGESPFQLQRRASLSEGEWENVGDPTDVTQANDTVDTESKRMFYRVLAH